MFVSLNLAVFLGTYKDRNDQNIVERQTFQTREKASIDAAKNIMLNQISIILADLKFVENNVVDMERLAVDKEYVNALWVDFLESKVFYDQIRFIDKDGFEKIRVNAGEDKAIIVPEDLLQNKADRYYFIDSINLEPDDYYVSRLDLNIENENIEIPYKPMIRFSKPVYDGDDLLGISVINYLANYLLDSFVDNIELTHTTDVFLLNEEGYWLLSSNDQFIEWGFMFPEHKNSTFKHLEPEVWNEIQGNREGTIETDRGIYSYATVLPETKSQKGLTNIANDNIILGEGNWHIVTYLSSSDEKYIHIYNFSTYFQYIFAQKLGVTLVIMLSILLFSLVLGWYLKTKIDAERASKYDGMTLAYNRQYGLEKAEELFKSSQRNKINLGLIFFDINGLKYVNDNYGHEMGDQLIISIAETI